MTKKQNTTKHAADEPKKARQKLTKHAATRVYNLLKVQEPKYQSVAVGRAPPLKKRKSQMAGSTQLKSQKLRNRSVHAHEVSSNGGGIATNRSIRT